MAKRWTTISLFLNKRKYVNLKKVPQSATCKFSNLWHIKNQNVLSYNKSTIESSRHPNLKQANKPSCSKYWSFPNSIGRFPNLWHSNNQNVFSSNKSTVQSSKHPNLEQVDKSYSTKFWSFLNSIGKFSICAFWTIEMSIVVTSP